MPRPPQLPPELDPSALEAHELESGERVRERRLVDPQLAGGELRSVDFVECEIVRGDLSGVRLERSSLLHARATGTNLANLRALGATLQRVELRGCRMTGLQWAEGAWQDVLVADARADFLSLRATRLKAVTFRDCDLTEADLGDARLSDVAFERCRLTRAELHGTRFERCTMVGCELDGLRLSGNLAGVSMPWADVVASAGPFASALGVSILDG